MKTGNLIITRKNALAATPDSTLSFRGTFAARITPPRTYRIAASAFFFIAGLTFSTWASRIPDIQNKLHLSDGALGGVLFALPVGLMVSLPLSGWLVSRFGSRKMIIAGALLYPLLLIPLSLANSVAQLVSALFLFGIASNLVNIAMNTQAVGVEKLYGRSVMASFHGLWSLAVFAGALAGTFFVSKGLHPYIHFSIIVFAALIIVLVAYKFTLREDSGTQTSAKFFVKPDKGILLLGLIAFCCMLCEGTMADWSGVYFKKIVVAPATLITIGYVAFSSTMALGRFAGDWLVIKFGAKKMLRLSGILITAGLLIAVVFPYLLTATSGLLLVGFGVSSVVPVVYGISGRSSSMPPSTALAAVSTIGFLGFLVGPPLIGLMAQATNLRWAFTLVALLGFGTTLLAGRLKNKQ